MDDTTINGVRGRRSPVFCVGDIRMKKYGYLMYLIVFILLVSRSAWADWSTEIELYESLPDLVSGPVHADIEVDSFHYVHIVYQNAFRNSLNPIFPRAGLKYVKFDDHGHQMGDQRLLTDSMGTEAFCPKIGIFGTDSLWIMWCWWRFDTEVNAAAYKSVSLTLNGDIHGPERYWGGDGTSTPFCFAVRRDHTAVTALTPNEREVQVTVELPGGQRVIDSIAVWKPMGVHLDHINGFVDESDSLLIVWRHRGIGDAIFAKRIDTTQPFDTTLLNDHIALTPEEPGLFYSSPSIEPAGDSLLAFMCIFPGPPYEYQLLILNRNTFTEVAQCSLHTMDALMTVEGDSIVSVLVIDESDRESLHYRRYTIPWLELIEDVPLVYRTSELVLYPRGLVVASDGTRHAIYLRYFPGTRAKLCYRYWRSDLAARSYPEATNSAIELWPSPANDYIEISWLGGKTATIDLYNILGQRIRSFVIPPNFGGQKNAVFDLNGLPSGSYFFALPGTEGYSTKRFEILH